MNSAALPSFWDSYEPLATETKRGLKGIPPVGAESLPSLLAIQVHQPSGKYLVRVSDPELSGFGDP